MVKPRLGSVVKRFGCQTKAGEGSEIVGFDPVDNPRAHFLGCDRRNVIHFSWRMYVQPGTELMGDGTSYRQSRTRTKRRAKVTVTRVASACDTGNGDFSTPVARPRNQP